MAAIHAVREPGPGPLVFDPAGVELTAEEREMLAHPTIGGVVLFRHNYHDADQLCELLRACRSAHAGPLLVMVDHEGGRVQRFRDGFSVLPAAAELGALFDADPNTALSAARSVGQLMAVELGAVGVDLNLAPVLDIAGAGEVIGTRAFSDCSETVAALAAALMWGLHDGGVGAVAKHFPGHGGVVQDTHHETAADARHLDTLRDSDLVPFARLIEQGVDGVLPAHVSFPAVDVNPVGFSPRWLQQELRKHMAFDGLIISDDLSMAAAALPGGVVEAAETAIAAGCDLVLSCQRPAAAVALLDKLDPQIPGADRLRRLEAFNRARRDRRQPVDASAALRAVEGVRDRTREADT